jgi:hypothetical protein
MLLLCHSLQSYHSLARFWFSPWHALSGCVQASIVKGSAVSTRLNVHDAYINVCYKAEKQRKGKNPNSKAAMALLCHSSDFGCS